MTTRLPQDNLSRREFSFWTVTAFVQNEITEPETWLCQCRCGRFGKVTTSDLIDRMSISCGCYMPPEIRKEIETKRMMAKHPQEVAVWKRLVRESRLCARWKADFTAFLADLGPAPASTSILIKKRTNHTHKPGNTRWGTRRDVHNTKRRVLFMNRILTLRQFAEKTGVWESWLDTTVRVNEIPDDGEELKRKFQEHMLRLAQRTALR